MPVEFRVGVPVAGAKGTNQDLDHMRLTEPKMDEHNTLVAEYSKTCTNAETDPNYLYFSQQLSNKLENDRLALQESNNQVSNQPTLANYFSL